MITIKQVVGEVETSVELSTSDLEYLNRVTSNPDNKSLKEMLASLLRRMMEK